MQQQSWYIQKRSFQNAPPPSFSSYVLLALSSIMLASFAGTNIDIQFRDEHSAVSCSQHFGLCWVSAWTVAYRRRNLLGQEWEQPQPISASVTFRRHFVMFIRQTSVIIGFPLVPMSSLTMGFLTQVLLGLNFFLSIRPQIQSSSGYSPNSRATITAPVGISCLAGESSYDYFLITVYSSKCKK